MIKCYRKTIKNKGIEETDCPTKGSWIYVVNPDKEELTKIQEFSNIPYEDLENSLDINELPQIQIINKSLFVIIRIPTQDKLFFNTEPLTIIIAEDMIITIKLKDAGILTPLLDDKDLLTTQKQKFLIRIFQRVTDYYSSYLKIINKNVQRKKVALAKIENRDVADLVEVEETLNGFASSILLTLNVFERFVTGKYIPIFQENKESIEDIMVDAKQTLSLCENNLKVVKSLRDAYSAVLTNNLNSVMKFLTAVTIIITIPTIIASIYGMNVRLPLQDNPLAFILIFILIFASSIFLIFFFGKKKWM